MSVGEHKHFKAAETVRLNFDLPIQFHTDTKHEVKYRFSTVASDIIFGITFKINEDSDAIIVEPNKPFDTTEAYEGTVRVPSAGAFLKEKQILEKYN